MIIDRELAQPYRDDIVRELRELVRIPSVKGPARPGAPFGAAVADCLDHALGLGERLGFRTENIEGFAGHVDFGEGEGTVAVLAHLDVVPPGEGWSLPPFSGEYRDGRVYGRGSADNKCSAVAALYSLKLLRDLGMRPMRRVRVILGTDEESGSADMRRYFERFPLPDLAFVPDAGRAIVNREMGRLLLLLSARSEDSALALAAGSVANVVPESASLELLDEGASICGRAVASFAGKPAHGAWPAEGINAAALALAAIRESGIASRNALVDFLADRIGSDVRGEGLGIAASDETSGELTVNLGLLRAGRPSSSAQLDIRYPVTASSLPIVETISRSAAAYGVEVEILDDVPPLFVDEGSELVRALRKAHLEVTGEEATLQSMGGRTYAACLRGRGVAFGPGAGENAHRANEYVDVEALMHHFMVSTQALYELAAADEGRKD